MKKGFIFINSYANLAGIRYQSSRLCEELVSRGVDCRIVKTEEASYGIANGDCFLDEKPDFAVFLDKDKYLSRILERIGVKCFNSSQAIELCDDKMLTYLALSDAGVPMPETVPSILCYTAGCDVSEKFLEKTERTLGYPMIAKSSFGSLGNGVYLIRNREELKSTEEKLLYKPHLYQKYIDAHLGEDYRIIVIGGKMVACMKRSNANDFRSNIEIGGIAENVRPSKAFTDLAERVAELLSLDYCGVDLLIDKNENPVLCEVNSNAFFTGIEKATGINIAARYAEYIISKI